MESFDNRFTSQANYKSVKMSHNTYRGKTENCRSIERRRVDCTI